MRVCYVDESGDTRSLENAHSPHAPVCVILGAVFEQSSLQNLTNQFITVKRTTHPHLQGPRVRRLSWILPEIKGADLRRALRTGAPRRNRRHAIYFLDHFMTLLEDFEVRIFGRVWVKQVGGECDGKALYSSSMQALCSYFQQHLADVNDEGWVIADSRTPRDNALVSMSIFTQKFKLQGDEYGRILEMPTFGHSQNHAGIQIADLIASALIFPMATYAYCRGYADSVHIDENFGHLTHRYGARLRSLQYRYVDEDGRRRGGLTVNDRMGRQDGRLLFQR